MNNVKFYLGKRTSDTAKTKIPVIMAFNYSAKRLYTQTVIKVTQDEWDGKKQRVKAKVSGSLEMNMFFNRLEKEVEAIYLKGLAEGAVINNKYFMSRLSIKKKSNEQSGNKFFVDWERFLELRSAEHGKDTLKGDRTSLNHFREFCRVNHISPDYVDITPDLLTDFRNYLLTLGQVNNTSYSIIKKMRFFLNWGYRMGKHSSVMYREFKLKEYKGNVHFLTWDEIMTIYHFDKLTPYEMQVRDCFIWLCFTGFRFSDGITQLRKTDIKEQTIGGQKAFFAEIREKKTSNLNMVPLMPEAMEILNRYKHLPGNRALPDLNMQVVNRYIKKIAKRAGINDTVSIDKYKGNKHERLVVAKHKVICSKWGRKSLVCNLLSRKMLPTTIMSITGHKSFKSFSHYYSVQNADKFQQLQDCFPVSDTNQKQP